MLSTHHGQIVAKINKSDPGLEALSHKIKQAKKIQAKLAPSKMSHMLGSRGSPRGGGEDLPSRFRLAPAKRILLILLLPNNIISLSHYRLHYK
jgi:hypothetical protein